MYKAALHRDKAIALRQLGKSYPEILAEVPVVKSTLWTWLKDVELCSEAKQVIAERRARNQAIGVKGCRDGRIQRTLDIQSAASEEVGTLSLREQWLIGAALYWEEGSKEKEQKPGSGVRFCNSDPHMVRFFQYWLVQICGLNPEDLVYDVAVHVASKERATEILYFWSDILDCSWTRIRVSYKRWVNPKGTNRHKQGYDYKGMCRITVRRSAELNRKIAGWNIGIAKT